MSMLRRALLVLSPVALAVLALLLMPGDAAAKGGTATEVTGFSVGIAGAGSGQDVDSAWETCTGGALCTETSDAAAGSGAPPVVRNSVTGLTLGGQVPATRGANENSYEILENGAGRFRVEIDGTPLADGSVESVAVEDLVIDLRELTTGADWDYRAYGPGDAHYGSITIRSRVGKDSKELYQWWIDTSRGKGDRKSISVICLKRDGSEARRFDFHACQPTCYAPFAFSPSGAATESITVRCEGLSMSSTGGRKALCEWITQTVSGKDWKRVVTLKEITKDGGAGRTIEYEDCIPIRYVFPTLDASSKDPLSETFVCKPQRIEVK